MINNSWFNHYNYDSNNDRINIYIYIYIYTAKQNRAHNFTKSLMWLLL